MNQGANGGRASRAVPRCAGSNPARLEDRDRPYCGAFGAAWNRCGAACRDNERAESVSCRRLDGHRLAFHDGGCRAERPTRSSGLPLLVRGSAADTHARPAPSPDGAAAHRPSMSRSRSARRSAAEQACSRSSARSPIAEGLRNRSLAAAPASRAGWATDASLATSVGI